MNDNFFIELANRKDGKRVYGVVVKDNVDTWTIAVKGKLGQEFLKKEWVEISNPINQSSAFKAFKLNYK